MSKETHLPIPRCKEHKIHISTIQKDEKNWIARLTSCNRVGFTHLLISNANLYQNQVKTTGEVELKDNSEMQNKRLTNDLT